MTSLNLLLIAVAIKGVTALKTHRGPECHLSGKCEHKKKKSRCELCCQEFHEIKRGSSRNSVIELRKKWALERGDQSFLDECNKNLEKLAPAIKYDQILLCTFCFQFFDRM
jgi:hypothetical protein